MKVFCENENIISNRQPVIFEAIADKKLRAQPVINSGNDFRWFFRNYNQMYSQDQKQDEIADLCHVKKTDLKKF